MARTAICNCEGCTATGTHKIQLDRRGGRFAYLCDFHWDNNEIYGTGNRTVTGTSKKNEVQIGTEFELASADHKGRMEFTAMKAVPTNDCSLRGLSTVEFVFPTMQGLNKIVKDAVSIEKLMQNGNISMNDSCGTHLHVSTAGTRNSYDNDHGMNCIRRFYHSLFLPLTEVMANNREATEALFGRYFTEYAPMITANTLQRTYSHNDRYAWVNCINSNRIEFRLVKFQNARQYTTCVKACVKMVQTIDKNFLDNFNPTKIDNSRYETVKDYRKHKANVTANKLIKIFKEACAELGYEVQ